MSWTLKAKLPTGSTFDGEIVWNATEIEIPTTFRNYVESVSHAIKSQYINKYTGFETKKYSIRDNSEHHFGIMLVGDLPRWLRDALHNLAIACNGAGITLQFDDTFITTDSSMIYDCRWVNAGDFVDNSELLNGASMNLISYTMPEDLGTVGEYQKMIAGQPLEWDLQITHTTEYYRVI